MNDLLGPWRGARTRRIWPVIAEVLAVVAVCYAAGRWGGRWLPGGGQ